MEDLEETKFEKPKTEILSHKENISLNSTETGMMEHVYKSKDKRSASVTLNRELTKIIRTNTQKIMDSLYDTAEKLSDVCRTCLIDAQVTKGPLDILSSQKKVRSNAYIFCKIIIHHIYTPYI